MLTRNSNFTRLLFNRHEKNWQYKPMPRNLIVFALHMRLKIVCCTQWDECNYLSIHAYYVRVYDKKDCCNCSLLVNDTMKFFLNLYTWMQQIFDADIKLLHENIFTNNIYFLLLLLECHSDMFVRIPPIT